MRRRNFLALTGSSVAALPLVGLAATTAGDAPFDFTAAAAASGFRLARLDLAAGEYIDPRSCARSRCGATRVDIRLDALFPAEGRATLAALQVDALFDNDDGTQYPYIAWRFRADHPLSSSRHASFSADRDALRGFVLRYRLHQDSDDTIAHCALTGLDAPLLQPGSYVLAGPRPDGSRANLRGYRHATDAAAPLQARYGQVRDFDYLAFRISEPA